MRLAPTFVMLLVAAVPLAAQQPSAWVLGRGVGDSLTALWERSVMAHSERVACVGGAVEPDTVRIAMVAPLRRTKGDSLNADAEESLASCGAPAWIGTLHTHVRSTDDEAPARRFSPGDRAVMADWVRRWGRPGAFCVLHSDRAMHCEVWPPGPATATPRE